MAKRKSTKPDAGAATEGPPPMAYLDPPSPGDGNGDSQPVTTGRFIVILKDGADRSTAAVKKTMNDLAGIESMASSSDYVAMAAAEDDYGGADAFHFESLGIVVVDHHPEAMAELASSSAGAESTILAVEPEYYCYPSNLLTDRGADYLRGYRDAIGDLYARLAGGDEAMEAEALAAAITNNPEFTWGLQATRVNTSRLSGQGIKVAILDTGFDVSHPDFRNREVVHRAFVAGTTIEDRNGHGTHCIGTACGSLRPAGGVRRYGVAHGATIFAGKVFNNNRRPGAPTGAVVEGIEWAMQNGCRIASLSLGAPVDQQIRQYSTPIRRALEGGLLVVAAAGNNANRRGMPGFDRREPATFGFVEPPANADHAMAVAAVDAQLRIASFSARSSTIAGEGGKVNVAGPGVDVFSSFPIGRGTHGSISGTSMATPHVAGIAALWAEATGDAGQALWNRLTTSARAMSLPSSDVGVGLVQAPQ